MNHTIIDRLLSIGRIPAILAVLITISSLKAFSQGTGVPVITPQITSSGGEIQQGEFGTMFSTIGEAFASDSMKTSAVDGEATWTGFWQVMPTDTSSGVYEEWTSSGIGSSGITSTAPNPFDEELTIYVRLKNSGTVRLSVYDMLGREVVNLIDDYREAGTSRLRWQPHEIEGGAYFLRLEIDGKLYPTMAIRYMP